MNLVDMNELDQSARGQTLCGFCGRLLFGLVAYCPYCGRRPSLATGSQEVGHRSQSGTPSQGLGMPVTELRSQEAPSPPGEKPVATPPLFRTMVAGISALLVFLLVVKLLAPETKEAAPPRLAATASQIAPPRPAPPATSAAPAPSPPRRTESAAPVRPNRTLCSASSEAAGLCKP